MNAGLVWVALSACLGRIVIRARRAACAVALQSLSLPKRKWNAVFSEDFVPQMRSEQHHEPVYSSFSGQLQADSVDDLDLNREHHGSSAVAV